MATGPSPTVRRAGPDDAAAVVAMVRELAAPDGDAFAGTAARWAQVLGRDDVLVLLAERDGEPVGPRAGAEDGVAREQGVPPLEQHAAVVAPRPRDLVAEQ